MVCVATCPTVAGVGVTMSTLPPRHSGTGVLLSCVQQEGAAARPIGVLAPVVGLLPRRVAR